MADVEIYASMFCGFCYRAKNLLDQKGVAYTEIDVTMNPIRRRAMAKRASGQTSVPQIFINGRHLGGCRELYGWGGVEPFCLWALASGANFGRQGA
jgi:glutaredoxin 3